MTSPYRRSFDPRTAARTQGLRVVGSILVVSRSGRASFPPMCVKCGSDDDVRDSTERFRWSPPTVDRIAAWSASAGMVSYALLRRSATVELVVCAACDAQRSKMRRGIVMACVLPPLLAFVANVWASAARGDLLEIAMSTIVTFASVLFITLVASLAQHIRARRLRATRIDDDAVWLANVAPAVIERVEELTERRLASPPGTATHTGHSPRS